MDISPAHLQMKLLRKTRGAVALGTVAIRRLVAETGESAAQNTTAGGPCAGVALSAAANGERLDVGVEGDFLCESGAAVTQYDPIASDNAGRFVAAAAGDYVVGIALEEASGAGESKRIRLGETAGTYAVS